MCGIAGFWQTKRQAEIPAEILIRMGNALEHRGPDDSGVFYDGSTGVGFVHRRLSIRDGKGKWALRQVLYKYVPAAMIERPKMGFGVPLAAAEATWLQP